MQNRNNTWHVTTKSIRHQFRYWLIVLSTVLISYGVLTFEITLTRVFSVMLSYHYVFAIVSFALFGLGIGGMSLQKLRRLLPIGRRLRSLYPTNALLFAVLIAGSVIAIIKLPILGSDIWVDFGFWLFLLLVTLPFFFAGLTLAEIFERFADCEGHEKPIKQLSNQTIAGDLLDRLLAGLLVPFVFSVFLGWVKDLRSRVLHC